MISKNITNIIVSLIALLLILLVAFKYCSVKKRYNQEYVDNLTREKQAYKDTLTFVNGQLSLKETQIAATQDRVLGLESTIDSLLKNRTKKQNIKEAIVGNTITDTGFVLAPNEYVNDCEFCFNTLGIYKKENVQLRFERDSYDTLLRTQSNIQANRINQLEKQITWLSAASMVRLKCDTTRKVKLSVMGMANNLFLPKAGGLGLIYEDKKFNEFGAHVLFSNAGNIYLVHAAKTISFRRKK